jgi:hypothetical protein
MTSPGSQSLEAYLGAGFPSVPTIATPIADEAHVDWWRARRRRGDADELIETAAQFLIPVAAGASQSPEYVAAIRRSEPLARTRTAEEVFTDPEGVRWEIRPHAAGGLPVVTFSHRGDFETAYRSLAGRCEPIEVNPSVHALYLSGLPNPVRLRDLRERHLAEGGDAESWSAEVDRRRAADPTAFHDRIILLHPAPYAGLDAGTVDPTLDDAAWLERSAVLRLEHEFTHHATHRMLGAYRLHVHDEVLADLMGFTRALGRFDASLFLRGLGIDGDDLAEGARLHAYVGDLDPAEIPRLRSVLRPVAERIEGVAEAFVGVDDAVRLERLMRLASLDLRAIADGEAPAVLGISGTRT